MTPSARIRAAVAALRTGPPREIGEGEHLAALRELEAVADELEATRQETREFIDCDSAITFTPTNFVAPKRWEPADD